MRVARGWLNQGDSVYATTRSEKRASELCEIGVKPIVWDWIDGGLSPSMAPDAKFDTILIAVSHSAQAGLLPLETHTLGLNHLLRLLEKTGAVDVGETQTQWIYTSTTGVFAPTNAGEWVDEESAVCPRRPGSIAALAAEHWLASNVTSDMRVVLRPAGIYGPGRVPRWQSLRDKIPLLADPESYLNLIHIDDLATIVLAISSSKMRSTLYCVSDGQPVRRMEYYEYISRIGDWPPPVFETLECAGLVPIGSRGDGSKRVKNNRIQSELGVRLVYPNYREGLKSLLGELRNKP